MADSTRPHGLQTTRLLHQWDFPGKSTGVGCHVCVNVHGTYVIKKSHRHTSDLSGSRSLYQTSAQLQEMVPLTRKSYHLHRSDQIRSVAQSCPTLCDPMNRSTPGLPVHYQLPKFTQTHIHRVSDAIQPSNPQSSPSPLAPNPSQHQSLFQ